mgnify:CR=1 FL=1
MARTRSSRSSFAALLELKKHRDGIVAAPAFSAMVVHAFFYDAAVLPTLNGARGAAEVAGEVADGHEAREDSQGAGRRARCCPAGFEGLGHGAGVYHVS